MCGGLSHDCRTTLAGSGAGWGAWQFENLHDPETGLFFESHNEATGAVSGNFDSQKRAYGLLRAGQAQGAQRDVKVAAALETALYLRAQYYDAETGLFHIRDDLATGEAANGSLGHRIKALWFTDQAAQLAGDTALSRFAQQAAQRVFDISWHAEAGGWTTGLDHRAGCRGTGREPRRLVELCRDDPICGGAGNRDAKDP